MSDDTCGCGREMEDEYPNCINCQEQAEGECSNCGNPYCSNCFEDHLHDYFTLDGISYYDKRCPECHEISEQCGCEPEDDEDEE